MQINKSTGLLCAFFGISLLCHMISVSCASAGPQYMIKFAAVAPEGSTWIKHMKILDKDLRAKSNGQLGFRVYAGGIAGDELDILRKIRIGQIHCTGFTGVGFGQILPMVRVLDLPFLFKDYKETDLVHREMRPFFADQFRKKGFELLAWAEVGNVYLFSKKPIKKLKDLSGLKVWSWAGDPIAKETFAAMGVNPIPLAITDVTTAINTGMIDTVYAPPLGALALQWYTAMNYMLDLPMVHSTGAVLISKKYLEKLPQNISGILPGAVEEAMSNLTLALREQNEEAIRIINDSGLTIIPSPAGADLEEFRRIHDQVARELTGKIYPKEVLDRVYGLLEKPMNSD
ncbi:MAG: ABC transporter substrate-binding protein [Deltaproteobacteria bacterium]|nr:ABC transporter substrate-binding protein [Deltaproteobacteria bacterium]